MIATGAGVSKAAIGKDLSRFEGVGVYYGATFVESAVGGGGVMWLVGGNSAGQVPPCFWRRLQSVWTPLVRSAALAREHVALPDLPDRRDCYDSITAVH